MLADVKILHDAAFLVELIIMSWQQPIVFNINLVD